MEIKINGGAACNKTEEQPNNPARFKMTIETIENVITATLLAAVLVIGPILVFSKMIPVKKGVMLKSDNGVPEWRDVDDQSSDEGGFLSGNAVTPKFSEATNAIAISIEEPKTDFKIGFGTNSISINVKTGKVTIEGFTLDEASSNFWVAVEQSWPMFKSNIVNEHSVKELMK